MYKLYDYYRSSASFRVRVCLNLKNIKYKSIAINLLTQQSTEFEEYTKINQQALVPSLELPDGTIISQSLNIIDFIDNFHPKPAIYLKDAIQNSRIKQIAYAVCCDIHPLNNLRVLNYLNKTLNHDDEIKNRWYKHWVIEGFYAIESWLQKFDCNGVFCIGENITLADICLIPQVYNAERFNISLDNFPLIRQVYDNCLNIEAFKLAHPDNCNS
jgi:maleylacetoacetate isomerase